MALREIDLADSRQCAVRELARADAIVASIPGRGSTSDHVLSTLSAREKEVARLVAEGLANKEVGARLSISDRTVAVHLSRVFEKLGVDSRHRLSVLLAATGAGR
jgi:two-component system nitrate/nitrite response regulator NarL